MIDQNNSRMLKLFDTVVPLLDHQGLQHVRMEADCGIDLVHFCLFFHCISPMILTTQEDISTLINAIFMVDQRSLLIRRFYLYLEKETISRLLDSDDLLMFVHN